MIYLLEQPEGASPCVWFAFDGEDLQRKLAARGGPPDCPLTLWPDAWDAIRAFEDDAEPLWQGEGWRARLALREQLVATEALADA